VLNAERLHVPSWTEEVSLLIMAGVSLVSFIIVGAGGVAGIRILWTRRLRTPQRGVRRTLYYTAIFLAAGAAFNGLAQDPLVRNRDVSMVRFIDQWTQDPKVRGQTFLVIVGKAHLPYMSQLLTERYGFKEVPIEATDQLPPLIRL
jgi:hypothetical protein